MKDTKKDKYLKYVTEDTVERHLMTCVKVMRGMTLKLRFMRGWPDRLVLLPGGRALFLELKRPVGGMFEPLQERIHEKLRKLGFSIYVASTKEEIDWVLRPFRSE